MNSHDQASRERDTRIGTIVAGNAADEAPRAENSLGAQFKETAIKHDGGKAPVWQGFLNRFPLAVMGVALVSEYGFRKYGTYDGWEKVPDGLNRYTDAKARHEVLQSIEGPYDDNDSGLAHALQEAWNAMARAQILLATRQIEMRRGNEIEVKDGKPYPVLGTAKKV